MLAYWLTNNYTFWLRTFFIGSIVCFINSIHNMNNDTWLEWVIGGGVLLMIFLSIFILRPKKAEVDIDINKAIRKIKKGLTRQA